jgi:hypothetical protein
MPEPHDTNRMTRKKNPDRMSTNRMTRKKIRHDTNRHERNQRPTRHEPARHDTTAFLIKPDSGKRKELSSGKGSVRDFLA